MHSLEIGRCKNAKLCKNIKKISVRDYLVGEMNFYFQELEVVNARAFVRIKRKVEYLNSIVIFTG